MSDMRKLDKDAKAARLSVRATGELLAQIERRAQLEGCKVGQMVRILIRGRLMELQKTERK